MMEYEVSKRVQAMRPWVLYEIHIHHIRGQDRPQQDDEENKTWDHG
jgi:hypothetical protein